MMSGPMHSFDAVMVHNHSCKMTLAPCHASCVFH